ncbi:MAG: phenylalanine--tRNA ligase subunit beta [Opitutales bacterium]|nr:phenylalanine--tRNA ligase subunit beta [Opitutales bacterium]
MKASLKWLNKYVDLSGISEEEIAAALPMLGLEVESVESKGLKPLKNVVVGEILERVPHPDSDHLGVCKVKVALDKEPLQIVCGASNYKVGDRVPVALEGAELPMEDGKTFKIKQSKLRGVESFGMMCSARELGLGSDHSGLLILASRPEIGTPINDVFTDTDTVFEIELTANRGDCASHIGIARELAAKFGRALKLPELKSPAKYSEKSESALLDSVVLETPNCPLYTATCIRGVKVGESPEWLKRDLEAVGLRPINNVVDATNYVLMEYGQPLHAFSAETIRGKKIIVRSAKDGEKIKTLDGKEHQLNPSNTLICDAEGAVAIAGVMGGENSEVRADTVDVVLESAYFTPGNIRSTSRKLNIATDASYRYARDVDPKGVFDGARRAVDIILETAGGSVEGATIVAGAAPRGDRQIEISKSYIVERLGYDVSEDAIKKSFESLGFEVSEKSAGVYIVKVGSFRSDVDRPIDLVEELVRIMGSESIPEVPLKTNGLMREDDPVFRYNGGVADFLSSCGLNECQHYTLSDGKLLAKYFDFAPSLRLDNPLTSDQDSLRPTLLLGLLGAARLNLSAGNSFKGLFESGRIFRTEGDALIELAASAFVLPVDCGGREWKPCEPPNFYTAKKYACDMLKILGVDAKRLQFKPFESPMFEGGYCAKCGIVGREGFEVSFGAVNLGALKDFGIEKIVYAGEIVFKPEVAGRKKGAEKFKPFSQFPTSVKDVALVVPREAFAGDIANEISKIAKGKLKSAFELESVDVFDVYAGKGLPENSKSLAFSLTFRAADRTLKAEEVGKVFDAVCEELSKKYQVRAH